MNPKELKDRQAAADAICARVEDIVIVDGIPEYRPNEKSIQEIPDERVGRDLRFLRFGDLRASAEELFSR